MSLSHLDLGNSASCDVTAAQLELSGKDILRHADAFAQRANVISYFLFYITIHLVTVPFIFLKKVLTIVYLYDILFLHLYRSKHNILKYKKGSTP